MMLWIILKVNAYDSEVKIQAWVVKIVSVVLELSIHLKMKQIDQFRLWRIAVVMQFSVTASEFLLLLLLILEN